MQEDTNNEKKVTKCKNCNSELVQNYCAHCGQKVYSERFTLKHIVESTFSSFSLDKGLVYTAIMLIKRPGKVVSDYLSGKTRRYFNPVNYFLVIAGITLLAMVWFNLFEHNAQSANQLLGIKDEEVAIQQQNMINFIKRYFNVFVLLIIPFFSMVSFWVFKKGRLLYSEHLIINCYLQAQIRLIALFLIPVLEIFPALYRFDLLINILLATVFYAYSFKQIFKTGNLKATLAGFFVSIGGIFLFFVAFMMLFILSVIILKVFGISVFELLKS